MQKTGEAKSNYLESLLEGRKTGFVHSMFSSSLNIALDGELVHISPAGGPLSSFGVAVQRTKLLEILSLCSVGDIAVYKPEKLVLYTSVGQPVTLHLGRLPQMNLRLRALDLALRDIRGSQVFRVLSEIDFQMLIGIPMGGDTEKYIKALTGESSCPDCEILAYFTGRGKGLTPAGDDILFGYTLAQAMFGQRFGWIKSYTHNDWHKTTDISRAYAKALANGYAGREWLALAGLAQRGRRGEIEDTVAYIQAFGHTSGNDALFGFYLGILSITGGNEQWRHPQQKNL